MTNTTHTPGPWAWAFEPTLNIYVVRAGFAGERNICSSYGAGLKSYEAEANARLIAQAWEIPSLQAQIASLTAEIERLRALVKDAYEEGYEDGKSGHVGPPEWRWKASNTRDALQPKEETK